jgi:hypothetical protein
MEPDEHPSALLDDQDVSRLLDCPLTLSPPLASSTLDGALAKPIRHDRGNHPASMTAFGR